LTRYTSSRNTLLISVVFPVCLGPKRKKDLFLGSSSNLATMM